MVEIPEEFKCPILQDLMKDPVIGSDGHTYERSAIESWLKNNHTSPLTREKMELSCLKTNYALKGAIERFLNGGLSVPSSVGNQNSNVKNFSVTKNIENGYTCFNVDCIEQNVEESVIIAVLDVSGSMSWEASKTATSDGFKFSRLDLVKHSMKTVAALMNKRYASARTDLGIVSFSTRARIEMRPTRMDAAGLLEANNVINRLDADGGTHIWDGLSQAIDLAGSIKNYSNTHIILLTDGEPTRDYLPPRGIPTTLKNKLKGLDKKLTISCFGFGYSLDSKLLDEICQIGNGTYGYIPDCSMVGTIFVNYIAGVASTVASNVALRFADSVHMLGHIQQSKPRHLVIAGQHNIERVTMIYGDNMITEVDVTPAATPAHDQIARQITTEAVLKISISSDYSTVNQSVLTNLNDQVSKDFPKTEFIKDIIRDIYSPLDNEGQLSKAIKDQPWYTSWGLNHLVSYARALQLEQCVNFKDVAIQHFAGQLFNQIQDEGNEIFVNLPSPVPSINENRDVQVGGSYAPAAPVNMGSYYDQYGGCFLGSCHVKMHDASTKLVQNIKKGDVLFGNFVVKCVVKSIINNEIEMCQLQSGLVITKWHPIRINNTWVFPSNVQQPNKMFVESYYSFVLESGHYAIINDIEVCGWGHGFNDNEVISHEYFGSQKIVDDLSKKPGWNEGEVQLAASDIQRDPTTGLISAIL